MKKIGGNTFALFQTKVKGKRNEIGECENTWVDALNIKGWLDLSNGDSKRTIYSAKIQESTHMFLCDYQPLTFAPESGNTGRKNHADGRECKNNHRRSGL